MFQAKILVDVVIEEIMDLHQVGVQFLQILPRMKEAALDEDLKAAFAVHFERTKEHIAQLESISRLLGQTPAASPAGGNKVVGLTANIPEWLHNNDGSVAKDARLICAAQKMESYQEAASVSICAFVQMLDIPEIPQLLQLLPSSQKKLATN